MTYNYTVILEPEVEGGYHVFCPFFQGCHSYGATVEEAKENIKEAIEAYIGSLKKSGERRIGQRGCFFKRRFVRDEKVRFFRLSRYDPDSFRRTGAGGRHVHHQQKSGAEDDQGLQEFFG